MLVVLMVSAVTPTAQQADAPVPELPGAGRAVDSDATKACRERLLARIGRGVAVVPADYDIHGLGHWLGMRVHDPGDYRMPWLRVP